jgi:hypothetical protein
METVGGPPALEIDRREGQVDRGSGEEPRAEGEGCSSASGTRNSSGKSLNEPPTAKRAAAASGCLLYQNQKPATAAATASRSQLWKA